MFSGQNAWPVWVSMQSLNQCRPGAKGGFSMCENTGTPFQQEETSDRHKSVRGFCKAMAGSSPRLN